MKTLGAVSMVALAACLMLHPATAQTTPSPAGEPTTGGADTTDANGQGLGDIVITAQRKSESLQKAPVAVAVVGGDTIRSAGVVSPAQLSTLIPALQVANGNGAYANFYVRGVGTPTGNALTESAIAFNYDGVYIARPSSTTGFFYDLERVEVLKGPQGTLYGRNATGGAINVLPQAPTFELGGYGNVTFGNYNNVNLEGAINLPLVTNVALRVSGIYDTRDGYMKDGTDDQKDYGGRIQLRIEPSSSLSILIGADYFHQGGKGRGGTPVRLGVANRYGTFSPQANALLTSIPHVLGGTNFVAQPDIQYQNNTYWGVNARVTYKSDIGTFTFIPAYRSSKLDYITANVGFFILQKEQFEQQTAELRYTSPDTLPIHVLLGGYYFRERGRDPYNIINNQFALVVQPNQRYGTNSAAAFGRLTYDITSTLRVTGGLRYTWEQKLYSGDELSLNRICLAGFGQCPGQAIPFPFTTATPAYIPLPDNTLVPDFTSFGAFPFQVGQFGNWAALSKKRSWTKVTWRAGFDWNVTPQNLIYASYETGFKSGGFYVTRDAGAYQPETIKAVTIGSKNRFFGDKLQINLEAFYWKYRNQQISHVGLDSFGAFIYPTDNAGSSTVKGAEADIQYLLTPTTRLSGDIQYLAARYDHFIYANPVSAGPPQTACGVTANATSFVIDCSGRRPPQSPEWSINLGLSQTVRLAGSGRFVLDARAHYQSETLTSIEYLPEEFQKGYWQADAQLTYYDPSDRFSVAAFVNNLTDATVKGQTYLVTYAAIPTAWAILRPPRTYGVRLGMKF